MFNRLPVNSPSIQVNQQRLTDLVTQAGDGNVVGFVFVHDHLELQSHEEGETGSRMRRRGPIRGKVQSAAKHRYIKPAVKEEVYVGTSSTCTRPSLMKTLDEPMDDHRSFVSPGLIFLSVTRIRSRNRPYSSGDSIPMILRHGGERRVKEELHTTHTATGTTSGTCCSS